jgi:hypothetical protein
VYPRAKKIRSIDEFRIDVEFTNGEIRQFDVFQLMHYPIYQSIREKNIFDQVYINSGVVQWPNEVDISPDRLYVDSKPIF